MADNDGPEKEGHPDITDNMLEDTNEARREESAAITKLSSQGGIDGTPTNVQERALAAAVAQGRVNRYKAKGQTPPEKLVKAAEAADASFQYEAQQAKRQPNRTASTGGPGDAPPAPSVNEFLQAGLRDTRKSNLETAVRDIQKEYPDMSKFEAVQLIEKQIKEEGMPAAERLLPQWANMMKRNKIPLK